MKTLQLIMAVAWLHLSYVQSANILGVFSVPAISHQQVFQALWKELSLRGHQVTVLTPNPLNDPELVNLTEIDLGFSRSIWANANVQSSLHKDLPYTKIIYSAFELTGTLAETQLSHPTFQALMHDKSKKFDVMLVEFLHPLMTALSVKFNCPMIGVTSFSAHVTSYDVVGNPSNSALYPDFIFPFVEDLGFLYRICSIYFSTLIRYHYHYHVIPKYDAIARMYVDRNLPYLGDIQKNLSLLFLNVNPVLHPVRPIVPAVIEMGGVHLKKPKKLPKDLQKEMDNAKEGVVYFSLGSCVASVNLPIEIRQEILEALSELPYKVFWKWEDDYLPGQPKNVVIKKWFPQQDILRHPNIKVFLTQGGLQSIEEAISNRIPLVVMPFFSDQPYNAKRVVELGVAKLVKIDKVTKNQLKDALIEVAENVKYRNNVKKVSELLSDVPMTGLEKAVWWTEYVIRHKGAQHLQSPAVDVAWYQYLLLDVLIFLIVAAILLVYIILVGVLESVKLIRKNLLQSKLKLK